VTGGGGGGANASHGSLDVGLFLEMGPFLETGPLNSASFAF